MEHTHIVGRFDKDLNKIEARILAMGALVAAQLRDATATLAAPDGAEITRIVTVDRRINGMNGAIVKRCERLIALRQPMAMDLREAMSPINVAGELERVGDHAKSTAKRARKLGADRIPEEQLEIIMQMSAIVQTQLEAVLRAYSDGDIDLSRLICDQDRQVDALNRALFKGAVKTLTSSGDNAKSIMHAVLISRNFERVGDHIVNIARHVIHIVTGADVASKVETDDGLDGK
ncbi:phosphate signaling complex protein PhoU [Aliiroseovarius subalbicans]|uniref:phosphate signaling complex protein PhoU n=1 Tax=Aliiroseovarius subalbicans TaxID=2925840 RepID=UPI001F5A53AF|nr:phosphate signaling complex protein PhoU [Aliiroseovarius subalbicans]MCI2400330.1 phosphate signaling complex protein PhoU [Aliiroseovarius subalbicans]